VDRVVKAYLAEVDSALLVVQVVLVAQVEWVVARRLQLRSETFV
jgi:hypothetical protein